MNVERAQLQGRLDVAEGRVRDLQQQLAQASQTTAQVAAQATAQVNQTAAQFAAQATAQAAAAARATATAVPTPQPTPVPQPTPGKNPDLVKLIETDEQIASQFTVFLGQIDQVTNAFLRGNYPQASANYAEGLKTSNSLRDLFAQQKSLLDKLR